MDLHLKDKVALVAASSQGLGKAIARQLAAEGCQVMLCGRNAEALEAARVELQATATGTVACQVADLTRPEDIHELVAATRSTLGPIDILINNAGGPPGGGFEQFADEDWQQAFELNLLSYIRMIRAVLPYLKERGGRIINIASSSIRQPIPGLILSNCFRLGIVGLAKSLAEELAPFGILVNTVAPGRIATDRTAFLDQLKADRQGVERLQIERQSRAAIPLGRYGEPEEFAKVVTFLASSASSYVTGSSILVDGGMIKAI